MTLQEWCKQNNRLDLLEQWHPTKNNDLKPSNITYGSSKDVWWLLSYDDPETGKHFDFEWQAKVKKRTLRGDSCIYLPSAGPNRKVWPGYNDLETWCRIHNRLDLIEQYSDKNNKSMKEYTYGSSAEVIWCLSYDDSITGKHFDFEWPAKIKKRTIFNEGCPYISGQAIWIGYNDLQTWCEDNNRYDLIGQWSDKNKPMMEYSFGSKDKVIWFLPHDDSETGKHFDFEWEQVIKDRTSDKRAGCPYISGRAIWIGYNDLVSTYPDLVKEWHPTKNGDKQPCDYTYGSHEKVWWHKSYFDPVTHKMTYLEWEQQIKSRTLRKSDCPLLSGSSMERFTYQYLLDRKIQFVKEYKVKSLGSKRFDVYLNQFNRIIELDGIQHFTDSKDFFEKGDTPFNKRVLSDCAKNEYCKQHKIVILRIPYIYGIDNPSRLISIFDNFVETGIVPDEIIEWYAQFNFSNYANIACDMNMLVEEEMQLRLDKKECN